MVPVVTTNARGDLHASMPLCLSKAQGTAGVFEIASKHPVSTTHHLNRQELLVPGLLTGPKRYTRVGAAIQRSH